MEEQDGGRGPLGTRRDLRRVGRLIHAEQQPDHLVEHVGGQVVEDAAGMDALGLALGQRLFINLADPVATSILTGREGGEYSFEVFAEMKNVCISMGDHPIPKWGV